MVVLVCGASGLVGRDLCQTLEESSMAYIGIHNTRAVKNSHKVNILNHADLSAFLDKHMPTICINCIADRNVDECEKNWALTKKVNIDIVESLVAACKEKNIHFIHISTDYVFDGKKQPSLPSTEANPLQNYGITKFIAEKRILATLDTSCIIRVPVLYTDSYITLLETAVTQLGKKVFDSTLPLTEDDYSIRRPVFIKDLCAFILDSIIETKKGIYHFYNDSDKTTKYKMIQMIGHYLDTSVDHIQPIQTAPSNCAGRPYDTHLLDTSYDRTKYPLTSIHDGIAKCFSIFYHPKINLTSPPSVSESVFYLLDLDGTLINTDFLHYTSYHKALQEFGISLDWDTYQSIEVLNDYLESLLQSSKVTLSELKQLKLRLLMDVETIDYVKGADELLDYFDRYSINYAVVTNTTDETISHFKSVLPSLNRIKNWITRKDYTHPKPSPECYELAKSKFYKNEKYIVGVENTVAGYKALRSLTPHVYIVCEGNSYTHKELKANDVYFIKDFSSLNTSVPK